MILCNFNLYGDETEMSKVTKKEFIALLQENLGEQFSKTQTEGIYEAFIGVIETALEEEDAEITLHPLGTFKVKTSAARMGHNPATGEKLSLPSKKNLKFKASKTIKEALNS